MVLQWLWCRKFDGTEGDGILSSREWIVFYSGVKFDGGSGEVMIMDWDQSIFLWQKYGDNEHMDASEKFLQGNMVFSWWY